MDNLEGHLDYGVFLQEVAIGKEEVITDAADRGASRASSKHFLEDCGEDETAIFHRSDIEGVKWNAIPLWPRNGHSEEFVSNILQKFRIREYFKDSPEGTGIPIADSGLHRERVLGA